MLNRKTAREQAFVLIFEKIFNDMSCDEIIELAVSVREFETDEYCISVFSGVYENIEQIDALINEHSNGWNVNRIGKVSLAVMRLAIFELLFRDDIPASVSVNEAVELCKKFATTDDASFVNGVLGTIVRKVAADK